ncbi:MAG: hypothetical protein HUU21_34640 [Polyangiaceae bacterium]|nr:hypothetical protein [Polyangiaceae bacterium]
MKRSRRPYVFAALFLFAASVASEGVLAGAASPSGTASAGPAPEAPPTKGLEDDPPGEEKTPAPALDEWKGAAKIKIHRADKRCNAYRVREWVKIHCSFPAAGAAMITGNPEGVAVWVDRTSMEIEKVAFTPRGVDVIFPVRRGDGRLFELYEWIADYMYPSGHAVSVTISESWVEGEPAPVLTM